MIGTEEDEAKKAAAAATPATRVDDDQPPPYTGNEFVIVLRDGTDGTVEMAGLAKPEQFDARSPCHVLGAFLCNNMPVLANMAGGRPMIPAVGKRDNSGAEDIEVKPGIIGPDRERTLVLPS